MVHYRRNRIPGGTFFFTVCLRNRNASTLVERIEDLRTAFRDTRLTRPFCIDAIVVLPDHLHAIWTLPEGDSDYAGRWRAIKARFTKKLARSFNQRSPGYDRNHRVWQRRFWEHTIRDQADFARHVDYIHFNPVKHGLTDRVQDWPYSSFRSFVACGKYKLDWGVRNHLDDGRAYGE